MAVEPVFLLRRELPQEENNRYDTLEICLAAERVSGSESILGAQEIRGLWRVYPLSRTARNSLLINGLTLRGQSVQVHDKNPFIVQDGNGEETPVTKVWISDMPISCDNKDIESALVRLGCILRSAMIMEKIRNKDGKLTRFLSGRRFIFVNVPSKPLERMVKIGGFSARLYHKEQPKLVHQLITCSRCLQKGHHVSDCNNQIVCRECGEEGHKKAILSVVLVNTSQSRMMIFQSPWCQRRAMSPPRMISSGRTLRRTLFLTAAP